MIYTIVEILREENDFILESKVRWSSDSYQEVLEWWKRLKQVLTNKMILVKGRFRNGRDLLQYLSDIKISDHESDLSDEEPS